MLPLYVLWTTIFGKIFAVVVCKGVKPSIFVAAGATFTWSLMMMLQSKQKWFPKDKVFYRLPGTYFPLRISIGFLRAFTFFTTYRSRWLRQMFERIDVFYCRLHPWRQQVTRIHYCISKICVVQDFSKIRARAIA